MEARPSWISGLSKTNAAKQLTETQSDGIDGLWLAPIRKQRVPSRVASPKAAFTTIP
jgi:hypothetical protein